MSLFPSYSSWGGQCVLLPGQLYLARMWGENWLKRGNECVSWLHMWDISIGCGVVVCGICPKGVQAWVEVVWGFCVNLPLLVQRRVCMQVCVVVCGQSSSQTMAGHKGYQYGSCVHTNNGLFALCMLILSPERGGFWPISGAHCVYVTPLQVSPCQEVWGGWWSY